jgi:membrane protein
MASAVAESDAVYPLAGRLERFVHFCALVVRQFIRRRCLVQASALSYSTLLALIPLLVVALNVTSSLLKDKDEEKLSQFVEKAVASIAPPANIPTNAVAGGTNSAALAMMNPAAGGNAAAPNAVGETNAAADETINTQKEVAEGIHDLVKKTSNRALGATGLIFLVLTAISLLRGIEETLNDIWGVTRSRNWLLQIMLYWTIITLGPLLLAAALGLTGSMHMQHMRGFAESSPWLAPLVKHMLPIGILSLALGLFYKLTPNTEVRFSAAMIGGLCAGTAWHIYNQLGFLLVARAMSASKYYGSVFLIVLLMGGLYVLWLILLLGAQIAYAYQNRTAYLQDRLAENVNQRGREFVALRIMTCLGRRFLRGRPAATVPEISAELGVPSRLTQSVLRTLTATRLVTEVAGEEAAFVPGRPLEAINAYDILLALRTGGGQELPLAEMPELAEIYGEFARIEQAERDAAAGVSLLVLANRQVPPAALEGAKTAGGGPDEAAKPGPRREDVNEG